MEPTAEPIETTGFWTLVSDVWTVGVFGVDLGRILVAVAIFFIFLWLREMIGHWLREGVQRLAQRSDTPIDDRIADAVEPPLGLVPVALGFFLATQYLGLTGLPSEIVDNISRSLIVAILFWTLVRLVDPLALSFSWIEQRLSRELTSWLWRALRFLLWTIAVATVLEIWGVNVLSIVAGFGLLGIAVALGAQDLFKNLISGLLILTEKRLKTGDWVKVDGVVEGVVESIGFRSTKIRQFDKAPVYVPNKVFADDAVVNYGEMTHRRIYWTIGLEYRTTSAQLVEIREKIADLIADDERYLAPPDGTAFVRLDAFAASSIDLMIYCFTKTRDWGEWLEIKEELLLAIKRIVEEAGAGFAFPSQSLYVESAPREALEAASPTPANAPRIAAEAAASADESRKAPAAKPAGSGRRGGKAAAPKSGSARNTATKASAAKRPARKSTATSRAKSKTAPEPGAEASDAGSGEGN